MKKRVIIYVVCIIAFIRLWPGFYTHMTHMNRKDLEWATNRHIEETFYFQDEDGRTDSATITFVGIYNSLNPINNGAWWSSYKAHIYINYVLFRHQGYSIDGSLSIIKEKNFEPVYFVGGLGNLHCGGYYSPVPISLKEMQIGERELTDCVLFDKKNSDIFNDSAVLNDNPIISIVWSKKYGLVQYTFMSGEVYNRVWSTE